jgi:hypothetical protein
VASTMGALGVARAEAAANPDPMPGASKDECVFVRSVSNWRVLDTRSVVLYAPNESRAYLMQPATPIMGMTRLNEAGLQALEAQYNVKLTRNKDGKTPQQP